MHHEGVLARPTPTLALVLSKSVILAGRSWVRRYGQGRS